MSSASSWHRSATIVEREPVDGLGELVQLADPAVAELVILQAFLEDDADHPGEQRRVLTGPDLQVDVGERRPARCGADRSTMSFMPSALRRRMTTNGLVPCSPPIGAYDDTIELYPIAMWTSESVKLW